MSPPTIRHILHLIVAALVLPAFLLELNWTFKTYRDNRAQSDALARQTASELLSEIDGNFKALSAVAGALSTAPALEQGDLAAFYRQADAARAYSIATNFVLSDINGQQRLNTLKPFGSVLPRHANSALIERVAASGSTQISELYRGAIMETGVISICLPITVRGKLRYFLDAGLSIDYFAAMLASRKLPADWVISIFDAKGVIVARSLAANQYIGQQGAPALRQLMARHNEGHATLTTLEGIPVHTTFLRWPANGWAVAIGVPRAAVTAALWGSLALNLVAAMTLLALGCWLAALASRRIHGAMATLVDMSAALGRGKALRIDPPRLAEARQVASALSDAAALLNRSEAARTEAEARLRASNQELEQRVRDRTSELEQSRHMVDSIVEHIPAMICVKSAGELRYEWFNQTAEQLTGKARSAVIGQTDEELYPGPDGSAMMAAERAVLASNQMTEIAQHAIVDGSGETRYLHTRKVALFGPAGQTQHLLCISVDITQVVRATEQLRTAAVAFESQAPTMITDASSNIVRINSAFTTCTGYTESEILGRTPRVLQSGRHDQAFYTAMWEGITQRGTWQGECWRRRKNGEIYPTWTIISAIRDEHGVVQHYVSTQSDISARKQTEDEIRQLAFYDPLTKLPNRRLLSERLRHYISLTARNGQVGALMFIDLDNFKTLNDTLGHDQGDALLCEVATRLPACVRSIDTVARLGGDEFVVMIEALGSDPAEAASQAQVIGENVLAALNRPYKLTDRLYRCTPSIGITLLHDHLLSMDDVMRHADLAMYQAKAAGRNTLRFYEPEMQQIVIARAQMERDMEQALLQGDFELYYQAQVDERGRVCGAEALLRWHHAEQQQIAPEQFVALAEETGFIVPLGKWVIQTACQQLAQWRNDPVLRELTLSVNISPHQFRQADFVHGLSEAVRSTGADPRRLKLELTERLMLDDFASIIEKMSALRQFGVSFALDDFGIGYSSLSYLKRLPLDQLKIDRSLAHDVSDDPNDAAIARIIVMLGHTLGLNIVAEGVETVEQHAFLAANRCNTFQGFLFSEAVTAKAFRTWVYDRQAA